MPVVFTVFLLSGVVLLASGAVKTIAVREPYATMELCEAGAAQVRAFIYMSDEILAASLECRAHDLPIPPVVTEPLAPMREAR